jgi:hypothetical protein
MSGTVPPKFPIPAWREKGNFIFIFTHRTVGFHVFALYVQTRADISPVNAYNRLTFATIYSHVYAVK